MEGQPSLCNFLFYRLFYYMEQNDLLDPINENRLFALHYVYLPCKNRSLKQVKEAWNCHGLRTERGKPPNQLFTAGLLRLRYSGLDAVELFEDVSDEYGESEEGGSHNAEAVDDNQGVSVPQLSVSITPMQLSRIHEAVSPLSEDSEYGISSVQNSSSDTGQSLSFTFVLMYILHNYVIKPHVYRDVALCIGSFVRNFHIGFDPDYECHKKTRPVCNNTPDDRIV